MGVYELQIVDRNPPFFIASCIMSHINKRMFLCQNIFQRFLSRWLSPTAAIHAREAEMVRFGVRFVFAHRTYCSEDNSIRWRHYIEIFPGKIFSFFSLSLSLSITYTFAFVDCTFIRITIAKVMASKTMTVFLNGFSWQNKLSQFSWNFTPYAARSIIKWFSLAKSYHSNLSQSAGKCIAGEKMSILRYLEYFQTLHWSSMLIIDIQHIQFINKLHMPMVRKL